VSAPRGLAALGLVLALHGCALTAVETRRPAAARTTSDRLLIVARAASLEDRPIADRAAALMAHALRDTIDTVDLRRLRHESEVLGSAAALGRLLERLGEAGWPSPEEGAALFAHHGVAAMLALEVTEYDQVWGRYGKFTRVGLVARMVEVSTGALLVDQHRELEVDEMRGRAFQFALERVVAELASSLDPRPGVSIVNAWRFWRR
jgi:hypothetical protein